MGHVSVGAPVQEPAPAPFIVGVARSGTTLLRLMLDAHPEMAIPPENYILSTLIEGERPVESLDAGEFLRIVLGLRAFPDMGLSPEAVAEEVWALRPFSAAAGVRAVYGLYARVHRKRRWGDKTPAYGRHMREIEAILPEACFVHIVRDGRDVVLSLREQWFAPSLEIGELARHWVDEIEAIERAGGHCESYSTVRFERLVTDTRAVLTEICAELGLSFDPAMERYHEQAAARLGEVRDQVLPGGQRITRGARLAKHERTGSPPDPSRIGAWRSAMKNEDRLRFEAIAGPLLKRLGYEV